MGFREMYAINEKWIARAWNRPKKYSIHWKMNFMTIQSLLTAIANFVQYRLHDKIKMLTAYFTYGKTAERGRKMHKEYTPIHILFLTFLETVIRDESSRYLCIVCTEGWSQCPSWNVRSQSFKNIPFSLVNSQNWYVPKIPYAYSRKKCQWGDRERDQKKYAYNRNMHIAGMHITDQHLH